MPLEPRRMSKSLKLALYAAPWTHPHLFCDPHSSMIEDLDSSAILNFGWVSLSTSCTGHKDIFVSSYVVFVGGKI